MSSLQNTASITTEMKKIQCTSQKLWLEYVAVYAQLQEKS